MYPPPAGRNLTAEQVQELDDTFLSSNPFEYFRSRIAALLAWQEHAPTDLEPSKVAVADSFRSEFNAYLQRPAADKPFTALDVHAQIAADAFSLRHHAAEALLRLVDARLTHSQVESDPCLWATLSTSSHRIEEVVSRVRELATSAGATQRLVVLLVPPRALESDHNASVIAEAGDVFIAWIDFAIALLTPKDIDPQTANNKVKHGLAVRARSDMRVTFTSRPPNKDGSIPLSALTGDDAIDIFDQPVLEVLAPGPKADGHRQGLEVTQLRLKPSALLAQTFMLAMTHAAVFHVAAIEHFAQREYSSDHATPPHPGYPIGGPRPHDIDIQSPLGMRFPLTQPPNGGPVARPAGIGFHDSFVPFQIEFRKRATGRVTEG